MDVTMVGRNYAVGWGTLALINAGLAQSKGRSRMAWFLASLLLGPVATFIVVITDNPAPKATQ
jgi:type IV secretory pathway VirB2 component (pilin)